MPPSANFVRGARNVRILGFNLLLLRRAGDRRIARSRDHLNVSFAFTKPIALSLGLIFLAAGFADAVVADSAVTQKKSGDLAFWEELAFWETIKNSKDPSEFEAYLATYPKGRFARLAEIRIKALQNEPPAAEGEPTAPVTSPVDEPQEEAGRGSAERPADSSETTAGAASGTTGATFRDCTDCPMMVEVPAGSYMMGSDTGRPDERPRHEVRFTSPFAIGVHEVTLAEWDACLREGGCRLSPESGSDPSLPVGNLSWDDAQAYVDWLSRKTGQAYRLPTEAEWEYAASGGNATAYWWGDEAGRGNANCSDCGSAWDGQGPASAGSFAPNPFGLFDVHGNLWEWTMDCMNDSYQGAPADGSAWLRGDCISRVLRGGSWNLGSEYMRTTRRNHYDRDVRYYLHGLRVARPLP